jgi:hypothetical protein
MFPSRSLAIFPVVPDQSACNEESSTLLGNITVLFDLIFIFQHFVLYQEQPAERKPGLSVALASSPPVVPDTTQSAGR